MDFGDGVIVVVCQKEEDEIDIDVCNVYMEAFGLVHNAQLKSIKG